MIERRRSFEYLSCGLENSIYSIELNFRFECQLDREISPECKLGWPQSGRLSVLCEPKKIEKVNQLD